MSCSFCELGREEYVLFKVKERVTRCKMCLECYKQHVNMAFPKQSTLRLECGICNRFLNLGTLLTYIEIRDIREAKDRHMFYCLECAEEDYDELWKLNKHNIQNNLTK